EDGIRDFHVTGVQTCALPIYAGLLFHPEEGQDLGDYQVIKISKDDPKYEKIGFLRKEIEEKYNDFFFLYWDIKRKYSKKELDVRSEERRVGKECRARRRW